MSSKKGNNNGRVIRNEPIPRMPKAPTPRPNKGTSGK